MPLCLRASSCTIHDNNTRCYATINIIIGKPPFRFASLKNNVSSYIKHLLLRFFRLEKPGFSFLRKRSLIRDNDIGCKAGCMLAYMQNYN